MNYHKSPAQWSFKITNVIFLALLAFICFYPFWYIIVGSLTDPFEFKQAYFWPRSIFTANYWLIFNDQGIWNAYLVSILRVAIATPAMLLVTGAAAFVLSRREMQLRKTIIIYFFITMFFSGGLIPYYMTLKMVGLINTFLVYVIPVMFSVWTMIVMKTAIQVLPEGLVDAALVDGATYMRIYFAIILPLSKAMLAVLGLFAAVGWWNDWFVGAFYVSDIRLKPLQTYLQSLMMAGVGQDNIGNKMSYVPAIMDMDWLTRRQFMARITMRSLSMSYIVVGVFPIMILYPFLQKYFVKGVLIGSLKE